MSKQKSNEDIRTFFQSNKPPPSKLPKLSTEEAHQRSLSKDNESPPVSSQNLEQVEVSLFNESYENESGLSTSAEQHIQEKKKNHKIIQELLVFKV